MIDQQLQMDMDLDDALEILDEDKIDVVESPFGDYLTVQPEDGVVEISRDDLDAMQSVMDKYEEVAVKAYGADSDREIGRILSDADVDDPWEIVGRISSISVGVAEARDLAEQGE
jgi:hypothetical protein